MTDCYYQHKYGGLYLLTSVQEQDGVMMARYTHMYPFDIIAHTRTAEEFFDGRFTSITSDKALEIRNLDRAQLQAQIASALRTE